MQPLVVLDKAGVSLGGRRVLADIDLRIDPGEVVGVAGPNGSGKTTLVRMVATLLTADQGRTTILGTDQTDTTRTRPQIGMITHQPALIEELTLEENLAHLARLRGISTDRVSNALEVVGLAAAGDRRATASSFGMRRRVEIAHLLLVRPRLLLLDEAASGLDETARDLISALIESVRQRDGAALMVSHDRSHLESLCDRVEALSSGRLVGTP